MISAWPAGYGLWHLAEVDSTNAEALRLATTATGPLWLYADRQTAGRGRRGRAWTSRTGNLFSSLLIAPPGTPSQWAHLSYAAALAASDMVGGFAPTAEVRVKWPNDVLIDGAKIVGILLETAPQNQLVIGIGVNLADHPVDTPYPATSLAHWGQTPPTPDDALLKLAQAFARWYDRWQCEGFAPLREAWLARAAGLERAICVRLPHSEIAGRFVGVDADGALLLSRDGTIETIAAGDVFFP